MKRREIRCGQCRKKCRDWRRTPGGERFCGRCTAAAEAELAKFDKVFGNVAPAGEPDIRVRRRRKQRLTDVIRSIFKGDAELVTDDDQVVAVDQGADRE